MSPAHAVGGTHTHTLHASSMSLLFGSVFLEALLLNAHALLTRAWSGLVGGGSGRLSVSPMLDGVVAALPVSVTIHATGLG